MSFVRAKSFKGKQCGYLVQNVWHKGKVRQKVKRYLGRIMDAPPPKLDIPPPDIDFDSQTQKFIIRAVITHEFRRRGFELKKATLSSEDFSVNLSTGRMVHKDQEVVLRLNDRYVHGRMLRDMQDFYQPESSDDKPGKRLALAFSDCGIPIEPHHFVALYKKLYPSPTPEEE